ncbi:MAG: PocR ligand-binding domain-containing protein [Verrucomicrobia bacterium]|nr:PocR ligand-binding domain-containing protein [Verrucomicrobiota bacterium]
MDQSEQPHRPAEELVASLKASQIFRDYTKAFSDTFSLPLALRAVNSLELPLHGKPHESPFCALLARTNKSCASCLELQARVEQEARLEPQTLKCFAGLCDSAVPVRVGDNVIAFLQTGGVLLHQPNQREFRKVTRDLLKFGMDVDVKKLEEAYFQTRVLDRTQYEAVLRLLTIFAKHLAEISTQLTVMKEQAEAPMITKAKLYIMEHQTEEVSLVQAAKAVNTSAFYFCKMFRQATGLTFTDYLAHLRIEKVKNLLQNPQKTISEAAFEAGFQSLSQFNRVFRRIVGESPTVWRTNLHGSTAA